MELIGMDFMGPIHPETSDGSKYILVAVDYVTKFIFLKYRSVYPSMGPPPLNGPPLFP